MSGRTSSLLCGLAILAVIVILNSVELNSYFVRDDFAFVRATYDKEPAYFAKLFFRDSVKETWPGLARFFKGKGFIRPLLHLSFKIDYRLYGTNPTGYHVTNLVFHFLNAMLVFLIVTLITHGASKWLAGSAALLFAVHPAHSQGLAWIVGRGELITAFFYLLGFYFYLRYRSESVRWYYVGSLLCFFLALFTKETAVTLPFMLMAYDVARNYFPFQKRDTANDYSSSLLETIFQCLVSWRETAAKYAAGWLPYLGILVFYFIVRKMALGTFIGGYGGHTGLGIKTKLLVFIEYLRYTFLASAFNPEDFMYIFSAGYRYCQGPLNLAEISITVFYVLFLLLLFITSRRIHWPLFIFSMVWIAVSYIMVFFNIYIAPLLLYLPVVGLSSLLACLIFSPPSKRVGVLVLSVLVVFYSAHQFKYNSDYAEAGRITRQIKETVETASRDFRKGDLIVFVDLPRSYKSAWVLWNGIETILKRPFAKYDLFDSFDTKLFFYSDLRTILAPYGHLSSLRSDDVKSALESAPLIHQEMLGFSEDPSRLFKPHYSRDVHLFAWNEKAIRLEEIPSADFARWVRTRIQEAAQERGKYVQWLRSRDWKLRYKAVKALGGLVDERDTDLLIRALRDADEEVRVQAAWALGRLGGQEAVQALIRAVRDEDSKVRAQAAQSLGELKNPNAVDVLIEALSDKDRAVRVAAALALGHLGDPKALDALLHVVRDEDEGVRTHAIKALGELKDSKAFDALVQATQDNEEIVRAQAAWALGELKDARSVQALIQLTRDNDPAVRSWAVWALGNLKDSKIAGILIGALKDNDESVRAQAARVLGESKEPFVLGELARAAKDPNERVRAEATWALGELKDMRALEVLVQAAQDKNEEVRAQAISGLGSLNSPRALSMVIQATKDSDATVRARAAQVLGRLRNPATLSTLAQAARDKDKGVRIQAIEGLSQWQDPQAVDVLIQTIKDEDTMVRAQAVRALGQLKNPKALDALLRAIEDNDESVRAQAAWALGELKDTRAVEPLIYATNDRSVSVRTLSVWALGELRDKRAIHALLQATQDENEWVRAQAAWALGQLKDQRAVEALIRSAEDKNDQVRIWSVWALGEIKDTRAIKVLNRAVTDKNDTVRTHAVSALNGLTRSKITNGIEPFSKIKNGIRK